MKRRHEFHQHREMLLEGLEFAIRRTLTSKPQFNATLVREGPLPHVNNVKRVAQGIEFGALMPCEKCHPVASGHGCLPQAVSRCVARSKQKKRKPIREWSAIPYATSPATASPDVDNSVRSSKRNPRCCVRCVASGGTPGPGPPPRRPRRSATAPTVPEPRKGSSTSPPIGQPARMHGSI